MESFRISSQADGIAVLLSLSGMAVDGWAAVFEVRHEAAFGWAVSALAVCGGSVRVSCGDVVTSSVEFLSLFREVVELERGPFREFKCSWR